MPKKTKIGGQKGPGMKLPSLDVTLPTPGELSMAAAKETKKDLVEKLSSGRDAEGNRQGLKKSTLESRRRQGIGGTTAFRATGKLIDGMTAESSGAGSAVVRVSPDRVDAAERLEKWGRPALAVTDEPLEAVLRRFLDKALR